MLEKRILEPGNGACESYLSKLRDVNIRFDANSRPATVRVLEESPKKETFAELPRIPAHIPSRVSSRKEILQSFAQYRDQMHHEFHHLKSDIQQQTQKTCSVPPSPENKRDKGISSYSTEFTFEIPDPWQASEPNHKQVEPLLATSVLPMETMSLELEKFLEEPSPEMAEEEVTTKKIVSQPQEKQKLPSLPANPFAQLLVEKKEATRTFCTPGSSLEMWQQKLNCFAAAGIACGVVILGMAFCHGNTGNNVWNLGFSFGIAGITSLLTSGILSPWRKISRPV
ncbi:MAG: hypothetical protein Q4D62_06570 [Planctomycetia bacterium]|nr:hypothetical protein [Planctomycetia bacterium]